MANYKPLTEQEIRSFRARGRDRELEVDYDWCREKLRLCQSKRDSLIKTIADKDEYISKLNVDILKIKALIKGGEK
jgi:hypothetical protein